MYKFEKMKSVYDCYNEYGLEHTSATFNLKNKSIKKYVKMVQDVLADASIINKNFLINDNNSLDTKQYTEPQEELYTTTKKIKLTEREKLLNVIDSKYTDAELKLLVKSHTPHLTQGNQSISFSGNEITIGVMTDSHIGSRFFREDWWDAALSEFENQNVDFICHCGDLVDGISNRPGHVHELTHTSYDAQKRYAIDLLNRTNIPIYAIDGNHDRYFVKNCGAFICKDISEIVPHYHFLGNDIADISINNKIVIRLWHGEDGSSYAKSYRIQKIIESFQGGTKPHILLSGHAHKAIYMFDRNVHAFEGGTICEQSNWMRSKKLANDSGFWLLKVSFDDNGINSCTSTFYPLYIERNINLNINI